jgi:hypothetical protein
MELGELNYDRRPHGRGRRAAKEGIFCASKFDSPSSIAEFNPPKFKPRIKINAKITIYEIPYLTERTKWRQNPVKI